MDIQDNKYSKQQIQNGKTSITTRLNGQIKSPYKKLGFLNIMMNKVYRLSLMNVRE